MAKHNSAAVKSDEAIRCALEYGQAAQKVPSEIIQPAHCVGGLYLGGYKAVQNSTFLKRKNVTHVVNTAKGLEMFGPSYIRGLNNAKGLGVTFLEMNWCDDSNQTLSAADLSQAVHFIHISRMAGGSVIVHCAQGKSRSTSVILAYLLSLPTAIRVRTLTSSQYATAVNGSLAKVQEKRAMAEPNPNFMSQLVAHAKEGLFDTLAAQLATDASPSKSPIAQTRRDTAGTDVCVKTPGAEAHGSSGSLSELSAAPDKEGHDGRACGEGSICNGDEGGPTDESGVASAAQML
jgi:atypical dual specificity phosphatase